MRKTIAGVLAGMSLACGGATGEPPVGPLPEVEPAPFVRPEVTVEPWRSLHLPPSDATISQIEPHMLVAQHKGLDPQGVMALYGAIMEQNGWKKLEDPDPARASRAYANGDKTIYFAAESGGKDYVNVAAGVY